MFHRTKISSTLTSLSGVLFLASAAFGQADSSSGDQPLKGPSAPSAPADGHRHMKDGHRPMGALLDSLNLDETQRKNIDAAIATIHEQNKDKMTPPSDEQMSQMKDLREQMRAARESKDQAKMQELRTQLDTVTAPQREQHEQVQGQIHDAIKAQLRPDQVDNFEQKWTAFTSESGKFGPGKSRGPGGRSGAQDPRMFHHAVMSLDSLTVDQRTQLDKIFQDFRSAMRTGKAGGQTVDRKTAFSDLRTKVESVLTDAQKTQLASKVQSGGRMKNRGAHHGQKGTTSEPNDSGA